MINRIQLSAALTALLAAAAAGMLVVLFKASSNVQVTRRIPQSATGAQNNPPAKTGLAPAPASSNAASDLKGIFQKLDGVPGRSDSVWPGFRGRQFDNVAQDAAPLSEEWPASGPPQLWSVQLSEGHGGAAVWKGSVYLLDYDEKLEGDALRVFSLEDGREIWRRSYHSPAKRNHGVSRTVPAVNDRFVVTIGPRCHVLCVDRSNGDFKWGLDLVKDFGSEVPLWYTGQCPLLDGDVAVIAPGGKSLLMGVDCSTGRTVWETPNQDGWKMSHSSVMPMTLLGRKMYVYCSMGGVAGVSAEPGDRGKLLWKTSLWTHSVLSPSPVAVDDHRIFLTAGYGGGSMMLGLREDQNGITPEVLFKLPKTVFSCEQHTPILTQQHLFAVLPKDASALRGQFTCLKLNGEIAWSSGMTERFGLGPFLAADGKFFILNDTGELTLARISTAGFEKLARAKVLQGRDAWAPMTLVDGRLLLRDSEKLVCLDVRKTTASKPSHVAVNR